MARIRTIKPEFTQHDELSALPADTHLFAAGLLCHCDDEGYFDANARRLKSLIFPLRECSVSPHDMLTQLSNIEFVQLGTTPNGREYGRVLKFSEHQRVNRATPSKIKDLAIAWESSVSAQGKLTESSPLERKGREGNGMEVEGKGVLPGASSAPPSASVITLPLNDGSEFPVTTEQAEEFSRLYPAVDVMQSLRAMRGWLNSNPANRKTKRGVMAFVNRWLARDQDDAPKRTADPVNPAASLGANRTPAPRKPQPKLPANPNASTGKLALLKILEAAKKSGGVDRHSFDVWFQPLRSLGIADGVLYIGVPSDDFDYVGQRYGEMISGVIEGMGLTAVRYVTQGESNL